MQIRYHCPTDRCVAIIEYEPLEECGPAMPCPRCGVEHPMDITDTVRTGARVDRCVVCGGREMFVRKDFPQALGVAIVIIFGLTAIYLFRTNLVAGWAVLAAAILLDLCIYLMVGRLTICYACRAEYRKCDLNPDHEGFDLSASEKY